MRLVTWNCGRGTYAENRARLATLAPDFAALQECGRPDVQAEDVFWAGDRETQGVCTIAPGARPLGRREGAPDWFLPYEVPGPVPFVLVNVWAHTGPGRSYIRSVLAGVDTWTDVLASGACVLAGDFNLHPSLARSKRDRADLATLFGRLALLGLTSAWHAFRLEAHGQETVATYYHRYKQEDGFHIDYCWVPMGWMERVRSVEVGTFVDWEGASDHRPMVVDLEP